MKIHQVANSRRVESARKQNTYYNSRLYNLHSKSDVILDATQWRLLPIPVNFTYLIIYALVNFLFIYLIVVYLTMMSVAKIK
jgi:hypothetical protein